MLIEDLTNVGCSTREQEHILALEARVDELEALLKKNSKPKVIEVVPKDMVPLEQYNELRKLYNDLWDETQCW